MKRFGYGFELGLRLTQATAGGGEEPATGGWDPATKTSSMELSNGNLTALTTDYDLYSKARSVAEHSTGKRAFRMQLNYLSDVYSCIAGVSTIPPDLNENTNSFEAPNEDDWLFSADGYVYFAAGAVGDGSVMVASGEYLYGCVDFDTGKLYMGNVSDFIGGGDPEAGTGPTYTFTPNTPLCLVCVIYSEDDTTPTSVVLDTAYTSGTFAAWDT